MIQFHGSKSDFVRDTIDSFDALTDLPAALKFEQIAADYPNSLFIFLEQNPKQWAEMMSDVTHKEPTRSLLRFHPLIQQYFTAMYPLG